MKKCPSCSTEYPDNAVRCARDQAFLERVVEATSPEPEGPNYDFPPLTVEGRGKHFVTLVNCGTLPAADVIVSRLRAAGIEAFIPDETLMQVMGGVMNPFGCVRVQVTPKDYDAARELLADLFRTT